MDNLQVIIDLDILNKALSELAKYKRFKAYFDELYGMGLEVGNWHLNGDLEPLDSFYESALETMEGSEPYGIKDI